MENNHRQGCRWALEDLVVYDAINGDFYEVANLDEALKEIKEVATDPEEGIHPDIESIRIYKEVANVVCEQVEGKETYKVKVSPIPESIEPCATSSEINKEIFDVLEEMASVFWKYCNGDSEDAVLYAKAKGALKKANETLSPTGDRDCEELKDIGFIQWYSGMDEYKIRNAYERYKREIEQGQP